MHTTNYTNTFIEVAEDCKQAAGVVPPTKEQATVAQLQYDMISAHPYQYTSDELLFQIHADRKRIAPEGRATALGEFFSKGQPCLRSSPLGKTYGWGIHHDAAGRVAIYGRETAEYARLQADPALAHVKAMRSSR